MRKAKKWENEKNRKNSFSFKIQSKKETYNKKRRSYLLFFNSASSNFAYRQKKIIFSVSFIGSNKILVIFGTCYVPGRERIT